MFLHIALHILTNTSHKSKTVFIHLLSFEICKKKEENYLKNIRKCTMEIAFPTFSYNKMKINSVLCFVFKKVNILKQRV